VPEAIAAFNGFLMRRRRSHLTLKRYHPFLRDFAAWAGERLPGSIMAAEIDQSFLGEWERSFLERNGRTPSEQTLRNLIGCLSSFYGYLHDFGFLVDEDGRPVANPMLAIEAPRIESGPPDWLRADEDEKLLSTPMNDQEAILVWLLRLTGVRLGEALALRWSNVDLTEGTISVERSKFGKSRVLPILPELVPRLRAWSAYVESKGLYDPHGFVLITRNRTPWTQQHAEKLVRRVGERAELARRLTPHKLRRTFGSHLLNRGLRIEVVSALLGHSHVGITQKSYAQLLDSTVKAEVFAALAGR